MDGTNGQKATTLSVNVFSQPREEAMVGERPKPFGEKRWALTLSRPL